MCNLRRETFPSTAEINIIHPPEIAQGDISFVEKKTIGSGTVLTQAEKVVGGEQQPVSYAYDFLGD